MNDGRQLAVVVDVEVVRLHWTAADGLQLGCVDHRCDANRINLNAGIFRQVGFGNRQLCLNVGLPVCDQDG